MIHMYLLTRIKIRGGNRACRAGLDRANSWPGQNRVEPKLARFFRANILTAQPALKTGPVGPNSLFKAKKISGGPGQIWPGFFRANNLMAQPGPNFGQVGLAHRVGPILPPLIKIHIAMQQLALQGRDPRKEKQLKKVDKKVRRVQQILVILSQIRFVNYLGRVKR